MLGVLQAEDWRRPALRDLDVQGLVGHLTGVEEDVRRGLAGDPQVAGASHVDSTQAAVHGMRLPLDMLLVVRAFELWIHENDIRQAAGMPPSVPDASTLSLMTQAAAQLLPHAAARSGQARAHQRAPGADRAGRRHLGHPDGPQLIRRRRGGDRDQRGRVLPAGRQPGHPRPARPAHHREPRSRRHGAGEAPASRIRHHARKRAVIRTVGTAPDPVRYLYANQPEARA